MLKRRHQPLTGAERQRPLQTEKDQEVGMGAAVALGTVATRQAGSRVRRPAALPEGIQAEPGDQIGSTFGTVPAGAKSGDEARSHVDAGGDGEALPGPDASPSP